MPQKFIFTSVIGSFVFSQDHKPIDGIIFKGISDYKNKDSQIKLRQKHDALIPEGNDLHRILLYFKDKKYFQEFSKRNLELTRESIANSVGKDTLIIQTATIIEELDRTLNGLAKRLRDWYSLHNPEVPDRIRDHQKFAAAIAKSTKKQLLKELNINERDSMGAEFNEKDLLPILMLASQINSLYGLRERYELYLRELEKEVCPNIATILGAAITAKLLEHTGSLKRLAEMPASTLQILGAEKALFRHLRNSRNRPPKYGILHEHPMIQKANRKMHGKVARALADKASIAARVDYFKGKPIGDKLKKELIGKFKIEY